MKRLLLPALCMACAAAFVVLTVLSFFIPENFRVF